MDTDGHRLKTKIRNGFFVLAICVSTYVVSYALDSFFGGYWLRPEMDGHDRYSFGLAMPTAILWQPRIGHEAIGDLNFPGTFYMPLIWFDRKFIHQTIHLSDEDFDQKFSNLTVAQVYPHWRDDFLTKVTATAIKDEANKVIRCMFNYTGSDHPREITEIKMRRILADSLVVSSPNGFVETPYEGSYQFLNTNYVHWIGKLPLERNQNVTLQFPVKQFKGSTGTIVFYYQRTDNSVDSKNPCFVKLK
jgi:hypothetical protein